MLRYNIQVIGAERNGHPVQELSQNLLNASNSYERLCKEFPYHTVLLTKSQEVIVKSRPGRPVENCPKGHNGTKDGRSIIKETRPGVWQCSICGIIFQVSRG